MNSKTSDQTLESGTRAGGSDGSLGEQLRRAREARGISLREISEQTRITMRHLEAIEADDYKLLPGGIFNRSFIKAYARHINFDEQKALDLYSRAARERGELHEDNTPVVNRPRVYTDGDAARSPWVTALLSALIAGILILIVYAGLHYYRRTENQPAGEAQQAPAPGAAAQTPAQPAQQTATPAPAQEEGLTIQVRAKDRSLWLTSQQDAEKRKGRFLTPGKPEDFTPQTGLSLLFDKVNADAVEVVINGRVARTPTDSPTKEVKWDITRDNYKQYLP